MTQAMGLLMAADYVDNQDVLEISGYLKSLSSRIAGLSKSIKEMEQAGTRLDSEIDLRKTLIRRQLNDLKKDFSSMKDDIRLVQRTILALIGQLKSSVKADEFKRFEKRIDVWAPESFVTRNEARRVIEKM
ncbi:MAG: hypothetical protein V1866_06505 [archaeon]